MSWHASKHDQHGFALSFCFRNSLVEIVVDPCRVVANFLDIVANLLFAFVGSERDRCDQKKKGNGSAERHIHGKNSLWLRQHCTGVVVESPSEYVSSLE